MKSKVKWVFLVGLLVLLFIGLSACFPTSSPTPSTALTDQQVAALIVNVTPYLDSYLHQEGRPVTNSTVTPTGDWVATYQGDNSWIVQGNVMVGYPAGNKLCTTTWTFKHAIGEIRLIDFACD